MTILSANVRVMRSYDYNHFEVQLEATADDTDGLNLADVDDLRKQAALLADEAVRQYKLAYQAEKERERHEYDVRSFMDKAERIKQKIPESERTVEQAAIMKAYEEREFLKDLEEHYYIYDDPEREEHFSMLTQFAKAKVKA